MLKSVLIVLYQLLLFCSVVFAAKRNCSINIQCISLAPPRAQSQKAPNGWLMPDVDVWASPSAQLSCSSGFLQLEADVGAAVSQVVLLVFITKRGGKFVRNREEDVSGKAVHTLSEPRLTI